MAGPAPTGVLGRLRRLAALAEAEPLRAVQDAIVSSLPLVGLVLAGAFLLASGTLLERFQASLRPALGAMSVWVAGAVPWKLEAGRWRRAASVVLGVGVLAVTFPWEAWPAGFSERLLLYLSRGGLVVAAGGSLAAVLLGRALEGQLGWGVSRGLAFAAVAVLAAAPGLLGHPLDLVVTGLFEPLMEAGDSLHWVLLVVFAWTMFQFLGIHGSAAMLPLVYPLYLPPLEENMAAAARGEPLPHVAVINFFYWAFPGGIGGTLPVAFQLLKSPVERIRKLARASAGLAVINLNEPINYGLPVVMNPVLLVPFVAGPLVLATVDYLLIRHGVIHGIVMFVPSSVPWPIGPWIASGFDPRVLLLKTVELAALWFLWSPFLRTWQAALPSTPPPTRGR